jgi:hypothetical protein
LTETKDELGLKGETHASKLMELVFSGESTKETMRGEGQGALDYQFRYESVGTEKTNYVFGIQVKTGNSFGVLNSTKNKWRISGVKSEHYKKWKASNQPVLLLWVHPDTSYVYWKYFGKNTPLKAISIPVSHRVNPSTKYEVERLVRQGLRNKGNVANLTVPIFDNTTETRIWAKKRYAKIRGNIQSVLGDIKVSNYAWRHLTRETRNKSHIRDSLLILPYVKIFMSGNPHQIQTLSYQEREVDGKEIIVSRKVLAIYRDVKFSDKGKCSVYVRLNEKIIFKKNWEAGGFGSKARQSLILESVYRKQG